MRRSSFVILLGGLVLLSILGEPVEAVGQDQPGAQQQWDGANADPCFDAPSYVIYRAPSAVEADGRFDEIVWAAAPWTSDFVEMTGHGPSPPQFGTRAKMVWNDEALYVAARLEEPHVWATLTERDARIYLDNAFEVFIDPNGDTHHYYELEVNALGTLWDLMLVKPYRDGGPLLSAWDIRGLEVGVRVDGTLNDPTDTDEGWIVELALPWSVLAEAAPEARPPHAGEQWRLNFSRSHWSLAVVEDEYRKDPDTPADWSVWSPQGEIDIHKPECWGFVQFAETSVGDGTVAFVEDPNEQIKWALRTLYYRQRDFFEERGEYADDLDDLDAGDIAVEGGTVEPLLRTTQSTYEITSPGVNGATVHIRHDGKVWTTAE
ncbi:MAG: carbohydrate-binding family 9-like protein [Rhodothermales bacterium]